MSFVKANTISEWSIENEKYKNALQKFKDFDSETVKENGSTFDVTFYDVTFRYGVIYDRTNTPHFESWKV